MAQIRATSAPRVTGEHVVFLGAGASRAFGHAVTSEILPEIIRRADKRQFLTPELNRDEDRNALQSAIRAVLP